MARPGSVPYLLGGSFHSMAYVEFGNPAAPAVVCVHGLTRNGRDFDPLAEALSDRFHVICPDLPGRGKSSWLADSSLYQPPSYPAALSHLLAALNKPVAWVGTSLGGICGILTAAAEGQPITRMVLNDIGPLIPAAALARIRDYMATGDMPTFSDLRGLERHLRVIHRPFGPLDDAQWAHLAATSARTLPDGRVTLHYDPRIADPIRAGGEPADADMWAFWDRVTIPVLAIRGEDSDLLLPDTFARMAASGAATLEVADAGHAPALMDAPTIEAIRAFLDAGQ
jgi:pimeloyl-ACP methyl ester carboxylesterase